jgi:glycosyltransferase involved in cell wall biosynthesis
VTSRRRVLVVPKWYPWPDRPAFGVFCREQARTVAGDNEVVVLASDAVRSPAFGAFDLSDSVEDGIRTLRLRYRRPFFRPAAMAFHIAGAIAALRRLRRDGFRPDVVHAHVYSAALPALVLARLSRGPLVVSEHYSGFQRGLVEGSDRLVAVAAFSGADLLAPVSDDLGRKLRAMVPSARIRTVPNAVDTDVFHPPLERPPAPPFRLLCVAWFAEKKGHADLLEAFAKLERDDVVLDLVGEGELLPELEGRARSLGVAESVRFLGPRRHEEVAELMREAHLFVLASRYENLPAVLIEAMASGLPSVATAVGGVAELIDEDTGMLVPPQDPPALADAITQTLERLDDFDPEVPARKARDRYGRRAVALAWDEVYDSVSRAGKTSSATTRATASRR